MKRNDLTRTPGVQALIRRAIDEDVGDGDKTSVALVPEAARAAATILARGRYVVAGVEVARAVFQIVDPRLRVVASIRDGQIARMGDVILAVSGPARSILTAERTALNFLQRLTGIATLTRQFVDTTRPYGVTILDTRKTTPGLRVLEKHAVRSGGGRNHRMGLYDMILIKDNHRHFWHQGGVPRLELAIAEARRRFPGLAVEVEVENEEELASALQGSPEWVLLDNMKPPELRRCVKLCAGRARVEASGGITLKNAASVAATGVDAISLGCLTHSAPAADLSLELAGKR